jgi:hypothetical protein
MLLNGNGKQAFFEKNCLMHNKLFLPLCLAVMLTSCEFSVSTKKDDKISTKEISSSESTGALTGANIQNDIDLDAKGLKVKEAYLMDDNRNLLTTNEVREGEKIRCVVVLDTGWTKYEDKSFVGASEKIISGSGSVVLDEADLFKDYTESGVSATDAKILSVTATITRKEPGIDDYKVQFRMWDKKGDGEVTGSFKFKVK